MENKLQLSSMYGKFGENNKQKVKLNSLYGKFAKINQPYEPSNLYPFIMPKGYIKNGVKYIDSDSIKNLVIFDNE